MELIYYFLIGWVIVVIWLAYELWRAPLMEEQLDGSWKTIIPTKKLSDLFKKRKKMKATFTDSFGKSLERLIWRQNPVYKFYEFFRYKLPMFFKNLWFFRKELYEFRTWDYTFNLRLLKRSLEGTCNTIEFYGWEIDEPRMKKVTKMKRAIQILDNIEKHSYLEMAEEKLGKLGKWDIEFEQLPDNPELYELVDNEPEVEKTHRRAVYDLSDKLENQEWDELWTILKGQNHEEYKQIFDSATEEEKRKTDLWYKWFDGSGMKHWWD